MTAGELLIRGSAEPAALAQPTTVSGTNDAGALTAGTLSTPSISFTRRVTDPAETDVHIVAAFTSVAPVTGNIDEDGKVTVSARLGVDLDIDVEILPGQHYQCSTSPVRLVLEGIHDGDGVVLTDEDFTIPATAATATCPQFMADNVNAQLQGSGHAITLAMDGALTRPISPGEESASTLTVSPAGPVRLGEEVTLTASVTPGPTAENAAAPTGFVTFLDGPSTLGSVELDETGTATLATTSIVAGTRQLRARYEGSAPVYATSTSAPVTLQVIAPPLVVVDLPPALQTGGAPVDVSVEATNTGLGQPITNARLDVTIQRASGSAILFQSANQRVTLHTVVGGTPTPVTLTGSGAGGNQRLQGSLGPAAGVPLALGESLSAQLRLGALSNLALVGGLRVIVTLVEVDSGGGITRTLAQGSDDMELVSANRVETTISAGSPGDPDFGIPETPAVLPARVRAGNVVALAFFQIAPSSAGPLTGNVTFSIGGRSLLARHAFDSGAVEWRATLRPNDQPEILIPRDLGAGPHVLTVSYDGDVRYRPATASFPLTVVGALGPSYECRAEGTVTGRFRAQLEGRATLPTVAVPGAVGIDNLTLSLHFSRATRSASDVFLEIAGNPDSEITFAFGPDGAGQAADVVEVNDTEMIDDAGPVDHSVILQSPTGQAIVQGDLGATVPVTIDEIDFAYTESFIGARNSISCTPVGDALVLGSVTVAGTTVEATPAVVGLGEDVTLKATSLPAAGGTVEFRDGATTIGVVPTVDGTATLITSELPAGTAKVTAIFRSSTGAVPTTVSEPIDVRVVAACPEAVEEGNGAVVRLVYMELLGRCPDAAGYAYWVGRLDGGTSPEVFARSIARTSEAVGRVVDDAYETMLERAPDAVGRAFWTKRLQASGRYDQLLADLAGSGEFWSKAGATNTGFVTRVYDRLLGRVPDAGGLAYWTGRLAAGTPRRSLVLTLANLDEPLGRIVTASYGEILDRAPDVTERSDGVAHLRTTGDRSGLYAQLIGEDEFTTRAQTFPEA